MTSDTSLSSGPENVANEDPTIDVKKGSATVGASGARSEIESKKTRGDNSGVVKSLIHIAVGK